MNIAYIVILLILLLGRKKVLEIIEGYAVLAITLFILFSLIALSNTFINGVKRFSELYGWQSAGLIFFIVFSAILSLIIYIIRERKNGEMNSRFIESVSANDTQKALSLIKLTPNINYQNSKKWTPLMLASKRGNVEIVKALISSKAKLNIRNQHGETAYEQAKIKGHDQIARLLIQAGAKTKK